MTVSVNNSSLIIAATAAVGAALAVLLIGPPTSYSKKLRVKILPPPADSSASSSSSGSNSSPHGAAAGAPQLSASWSFVDQSTTQLHSYATLYRARDHAEALYTALADPATYYTTTRQPEFGVEVLDRESGLTRFIRYRRSRASRGARVVVERRVGEDHSGTDFESDSTGSWFIRDTFCIFNTTVTIRHSLRVVEEQLQLQSKESDAVATAPGEAVHPETILEIEITTKGPIGTAFVLAHKYVERMETALAAIEEKWSGKFEQ
ncbi:hypothetical protein HDU86_000231 [Geranomyces michiganensis]|nr:hypothetical protein HDU86_000231 [Geranomyces michiganensis]